MASVWRSIDNITDEDLSWIIRRAHDLKGGDASSLIPPPTVGLVFLEASLRTRLGFSAATARLGGCPLPVYEQRFSEISMQESVSDTLRTLSGYCQALVVRLPNPLDGGAVPPDLQCPLVSGGDRGPEGEHPTQALIDLFAFEVEFGSTSGLHVVVVGDPAMRSVASLARALLRRGVGEVEVLTTEALWQQARLPDYVKRLDTWEQASRADVLYMAGIPHASVPLAVRDHLRLTAARLRAFSKHTVVTSPLPVIDEISLDARCDPRMRAFKHSDAGLFVRIAVLERIITVGNSSHGGSASRKRREQRRLLP